MSDNNTNSPATQKSLGEQLVRTEFNPAANSTVDVIKQKTAELINLCEDLWRQDARSADYAIQAYENAAMWAVKAATAERT
jgi:hypothetical protein